MRREAIADFQVHELITKRWSPYLYGAREVAREDLCSLFEASRWAASSFNEQPWNYIIARRSETEEFEKLVSCLVDANQQWASQAPILVLCVARMNFSRNGKPNKTATHDLGLATANLCFEATARGLYVHQMAGILPSKAKQLFRIPDPFEPFTAMTIGYLGNPSQGSAEFASRDQGERTRKPLGEFTFGAEWQKPAEWL